MIEKKTILDQIEVTRDGTIQVRFACQILEDGKELLSQWHRTCITPGVSADDQMVAVNANLQQMDKAQVTDYSRLSLIVSAVHTPDVISAFVGENHE